MPRRETEEKVKEVINKHYTKIIYKLNPDPLINFLKEYGVLVVGGYDVYYEELRNMINHGKTKADVNDRLFSILFTRENWWIPLINALRRCDPHSETANIIEAVLPESDLLKLRSTEKRTGREKNRQRSRREKTIKYVRRETSTDETCDSESDYSSFNSTTGLNHKEDHFSSRHHPQHFDNFYSLTEDLGSPSPGSVPAGRCDPNGQEHLSQGQTQTAVSMREARFSKTSKSTLLKSNSAPSQPPPGQLRHGECQQHQSARDLSNHQQLNTGQASDTAVIGQAQNRCRAEESNILNQGMTSLPRSQHSPSHIQQHTENIQTDVYRPDSPLTLDTLVDLVPCGVLRIFSRLDYDTERGWKHFAGCLTNKFKLQDESRIESKPESKSKQVIRFFRDVEGERATLRRMMIALKEIQRRDLLRDIRDDTGLKLPGDEEDEEEEEEMPTRNRNRAVNGAGVRVDVDFEAPDIIPGEVTVTSSEAGDDQSRTEVTVSTSPASQNSFNRKRDRSETGESNRECEPVKHTSEGYPATDTDEDIRLLQQEESKELDKAVKTETEILLDSEHSSLETDSQNIQDHHQNHESDVSDENNLHQDGDTIIANKNQHDQKPEPKVKFTVKNQAEVCTPDRVKSPKRENTEIHYPPNIQDYFGPKIELPRQSKPAGSDAYQPGRPAMNVTNVPPPGTNHAPPVTAVQQPCQPRAERMPPVPLPPYQPSVRLTYPHSPYPPHYNQVQMPVCLPGPFPQYMGAWLPNQSVPSAMSHVQFNSSQVPQTDHNLYKASVYDTGVALSQPYANSPQWSMINGGQSVPNIGGVNQMQTSPKTVCSVQSETSHKADVWQMYPQNTPVSSENAYPSRNSNAHSLSEVTSGNTMYVSTLSSSVLQEPAVHPVSSSVQQNKAKVELKKDMNCSGDREYKQEQGGCLTGTDEEEEESDDDDDDGDDEGDREDVVYDEGNTYPKQIDDDSHAPVEETEVKQPKQENVATAGKTEKGDTDSQSKRCSSIALSGDNICSSSVGGLPDKILQQSPPEQDLDFTSDGSVFLDTLPSSLPVGPTAYDWRGVEFPALVLPLSIPSGPPTVHEVQAEIALQKKMHPYSPTVYEKILPRPSEDDDEISLDGVDDDCDTVTVENTCPKEADEEQPGTLVDGEKTNTRSEIAKAETGSGECSGDGPGRGTTNSVKSLFRTAIHVVECLTVGTDVNRLQKWHSS